MKAAESQPMLKVLLEIGGYEGHDMKACAALVKLKLEATGQFIVGITDDWEQFRNPSRQTEGLAPPDGSLDRPGGARLHTRAAGWPP
jgi:type 1 glutamine amidotransferase